MRGHSLLVCSLLTLLGTGCGYRQEEPAQTRPPQLSATPNEVIARAESRTALCDRRNDLLRLAPAAGSQVSLCEKKQQWGLENCGDSIVGNAGGNDIDIDAHAAWELTRGTRDVVVAVLDSGMARHPDLQENLWKAAQPFKVSVGNDTLECPAGSHGIDLSDLQHPSCNPMTDGPTAHGTHVAGVIGASGRIDGVAPISSLLPIKVARVQVKKIPGENLAAAIDAVVQLKRQGINIRIISASWGSYTKPPALEGALRRAGELGILVVAAAYDDDEDHDVTPFYPATLDLANVIAVTAVRNNGIRVGGYGARTIDVAAPGFAICSTSVLYPHNFASGTSLAVPFVSGIAVLALDRCPQLSAAALKNVLVSSVEPLDSLTGSVASGGIVNAYNTVRNCSAAT